MTSNLAITTQPSIEDQYDEEFSLLVHYFTMEFDYFDFTDDEFKEALDEALAKRKETNS